jgi:hypothetical protein
LINLCYGHPSGKDASRIEKGLMLLRGFSEKETDRESETDRDSDSESERGSEKEREH